MVADNIHDCMVKMSHCLCRRQAVNRQVSLEQQLHTLKENEQALHSLQESLSQLDHTLTSYLTDRIDAFQLPQEAQVRGAHAQQTYLLPASSRNGM